MDTDYSADVVEFCPTEGSQQLFVCGTYQLLNADGSKAASPGSGSESKSADGEEHTSPETSRTGRLYLFSLDGTTPTEESRVETAAILDAKWNPHSTAPELAVADAKGAITFYAVAPTSLSQTQALHVAEESTLVLSLAYSPTPGSIISSLSNGSLAHITGESEYTVSSQWHAHEFEPWITTFSDENTVWSGGDDCVLKRWDLRSATMTASHRRFDGGVTTIAPCPGDENVLAVGSYDARLRLFDVRSLRSPVGELELPGGIWRTKWRGSEVLNACMHGGFAVVAVEGDMGMRITTTFPGTLGYGADWSRREDGVVATCSFYDHVLDVWRVRGL